MDKSIAIVVSIAIIGFGLGLLVWVIKDWRDYNYEPPKRKRRSTWQKPQRGRHRA